MNFKSKKVKSIILLSLCVLVVTVATICVLDTYYQKNQSEPSMDSQKQSEEHEDEGITEVSPAIKAGRDLSNNKCSGEGPVEITAFPMNPEDFSYLIPYGLTTGNHVTPIDHQYFTPTVFDSPRDTYEVYAPADGRITLISERTTERGIEYRMVFSHTCTFLTYYDLVTSLSSNLQQEFEQNARGDYAYIDYEMKSGELIGYIGGQTLDFAVWNTEKPLTGFVSPELYSSEPWKIYTSDPYDYYSDELHDVMVAKNIRTMTPIAGKIDYDIEGRLIGNWFLEGTNGYAGSGQPYYSGHLSIHPDHIDPKGVVISLGDFRGEPEQFLAPIGSTPPSEVKIETGLVKYDLLDYEYYKSDGSRWNGDDLEKNLTVKPAYQNNGCVLFQLIETNRLKMELFPGIECDSTNGFTNEVDYYER